MRTVLVLNGPNLGRLGSREPEVYGTFTLEDLRQRLEGEASDRFSLEVRQTDDEAILIGWLHEAADNRAAVVLNPAAFTHYSYALADAAKAFTSAGGILIEVHITNPYARETFRHTSVISAAATGVIAGFGVNSYSLALDAVARIES